MWLFSVPVYWKVSSLLWLIHTLLLPWSIFKQKVISQLAALFCLLAFFCLGLWKENICNVAQCSHVHLKGNTLNKANCEAPDLWDKPTCSGTSIFSVLSPVWVFTWVLRRCFPVILVTLSRNYGCLRKRQFKVVYRVLRL